MEKTNDIKVKPGRKFKVYAKSIYEMFRILRMIKDKWKEKEKGEKKDFEDSLSLYIDVAYSWLLKTCKKTIMSMLADKELDFDFVTEDSHRAFRKCQVRAESFINLIIESIKEKHISKAENKDEENKKGMPKPLKFFLKSITTPLGYLPPDFLSKFEKQRVKVDERGSLTEANDYAKQMMYGFFIIGKILISKILMKPEEIATKIKLSKKSVDNFKIISSLIWTCFIDQMRGSVKAFNDEDNLEYQLRNNIKYRKAPADELSKDL